MSRRRFCWKKNSSEQKKTEEMNMNCEKFSIQNHEPEPAHFNLCELNLELVPLKCKLVRHWIKMQFYNRILIYLLIFTDFY